MKNVHEVEIKLEKEWVDSLDAVFKKKNKEVKIDGFRKGMASKEIYLKHFGIESLYVDAIDACISVAYKKALDKEKLIPVIEPQVDVTGISDTNVIFKFTIIQNLRFIRVLQGVYANKDTFFHGTAKRMPPFFLRVQRAGG